MGSMRVTIRVLWLRYLKDGMPVRAPLEVLSFNTGKGFIVRGSIRLL